MDTKKIFGYTLLEIVIVIGILSVLTGTGIATIVPFKERREVLSDARNMASLLKQTQVKASAVEVPSACSNVGEFEVRFSDSNVDLLIKTSGGATCKENLGILSFSNGAEFVTGGSVVFKTPLGSVNPVTVSIKNYGIQYDLEINENGSVSEPQKAL